MLSDADSAGGRLAHMSLCETGTLPWLCCQVPGVCIFSMLACLLYVAVRDSQTLAVIIFILTCYILWWMMNMSIFSCVGMWHMRRCTAEDWDQKFLQLKNDDPDSFDAMHYVIIPNYKEEEKMLKETLENLGRSAMAQSRVRVVLGMELREGPDVKAKAERLIAETKSLFQDISATFHPAGLPGEVPGKASNEQFAFGKILQDYGCESKRSFDLSRVFVTVIDADTLVHPQYFSSLAYHALTMPKEARVWRMWQPPVLLFRNLFTVPALTRVSGYGCLMFELGGLANQYMGSHITFSTYSMTLALASHRMVDGWDPDVIAEDHHMFVKCYFAPLWEAALSPNPPLLPRKPVEPKVQLDPIYLPALCYMVESPDQEYWSSIADRFQQARRHSQGVAELSYCLLQYIRLCVHVGFFQLPFVTHRGIICIIWKMFTVHITNAVHATSVVIGEGALVVKILQMICAGELLTLLASGASFFASMGINDTFWYIFLSVAGPGHLLLGLGQVATCVVIMDVMEGRYDKVQASVIQSNPAKPLLTLKQKISLIVRHMWETATMTEPTILLFSMVPEVMASWSLSWSGAAYEYLVASKPKTQTDLMASLSVKPKDHDE